LLVQIRRRNSEIILKLDDLDGLTEAIEMLNSNVARKTELEQALTEDEHVQLESLNLIHIDTKRLFDQDGDRLLYLESSEFRTYLEKAEALFVSMMGPGRGIPGWDQQNSDWIPAKDCI